MGEPSPRKQAAKRRQDEKLKSAGDILRAVQCIRNAVEASQQYSE